MPSPPSSSSRKRKSDDVSDASGQDKRSTKETHEKARKKRASVSSRPVSDRTASTEGASSKRSDEDLTPRRKKARTEQAGSMGQEIPEGMSKKEWVALRKKEMQQQYQSGNMFSKNGMPIVAAFTAAKSHATNPAPKKVAHVQASVASSRPAPYSRPTAAAPAASSRKNPFPRRPSGPFNSPIPNMQFSASAKRSGPHIPDFSGTNDTKAPTEYLSPRSALAKASFVDDESVERSCRESLVTNENIETVQKEEAQLAPVSPVDRPEPSLGGFLFAVMCISVIGFSFLIVTLVIVPGGSGGNFKMVVPTVSTSSLKCFHDSPILGGESDEEPAIQMIAERCKNVPLSSWSRCPDGALCSHGLLQQCAYPKYYEVSPGHDDCVLSIPAQKTISDVVSWLELSSVVHACQPGGNPHALDGNGGGYPFFGLSQILGELDVEWDPVLIQILKDLEGVTKVELQPDSNYTIALDQSHIVVLPRKCRVKKVLVGIMNGTIAALVGLFRLIFGWSMQVTSIYVELLYEIPAQTLAFSVVLPIVGWLAVSYLQKRNRQANEEKLLNSDRVFVRQEAYKVLRNEPDKNHVILQVRDQILYDPNLSYHSDSKARSRIIKRVWSKVVADLQKDNRILKARINTNKGACDSWKWGGDPTL